MRAVRSGEGHLTLADVDPPRPETGQARIRVRLAGVCGTDLELLQGYAGWTGTTPGHEFVGVVEEAPGDPGWIGRRVVGEITIACLGCPPCHAGRTGHCDRRTVLGIRGWNGAFAEHVILPVRNLHVVPDKLSDETAVFTEPLAAAVRVAAQVPLGSRRVAVVGAGRLGTLVALVAAHAGADLAVLARHPDARARLAARGILALPSLPEREFDVVVDCTGHSEGLEIARRAVRAGGTIVLKSTFHGAVSVDLSGFVVDEIVLVGSRCGPFPRALELLESGGIDVAGLVDSRHPLRDLQAALDRAAQPGVMKVLVEP